MKYLHLIFGILTIICWMSCNPEDDNPNGIIYKGKIQNNDGEVLKNGNIEIARSEDAAGTFFGGFDSHSVNTDEEGNYLLELPFDSMIYYTPKPSGNGLHLLIDNSSSNAIGSKYTKPSRKMITEVNESNLFFCKEQLFKAEIQKSSLGYKKCEVYFSVLDDTKNFISSLFDNYKSYTFENEEQILGFTICKVDSLDVRWKIKNENDELLDSVQVKVPIWQNLPIETFVIEY